MTNVNRLAFEYNSTADYCTDARVNIGEITIVCCASGEVKLEPLHPPTKPRRALFDDVLKIFRKTYGRTTIYSARFRLDTKDSCLLQCRLAKYPISNITRYIVHKSTKIVRLDRFTVNYFIESLAPFPNKQKQYLQMYYISCRITIN